MRPISAASLWRKKALLLSSFPSPAPLDFPQLRFTLTHPGNAPFSPHMAGRPSRLDLQNPSPPLPVPTWVFFPLISIYYALPWKRKARRRRRGCCITRPGRVAPTSLCFLLLSLLFSLLSALMGKVLTHRGALASEKTILGPSLLEEGKGERKLEICRPLLNSVNNKEREAFANDLFCDLVHCRPLHLRLSPITLLQNLH